MLSFWVAHLLAMQRKSFTNGELTKSCVLAVAEEICTEKLDLRLFAFSWEQLLE